MNKLLLFMTIIILLIMLISMLILIVSKKSIIDLQKSTPFECGFNPMSYKRLPFSIHFFLIAVIFLIFDIEIIIIIPMIFTLKSSMLMYWLITSTMFVLILILGLFHEWYNGMLNWTT
uniref:NADH dehydrogenase subunit 3 n=1 Tax=Atkinsoniella flavipenna TaxID=2930056 RepID=UPI002000F515|nr:NADH dehydrogenase subunit 3 [Atkinsoniella flavipenna]YP_010363479.1 NADH dehydrogenase subunit 3 [Atkinsoniella longiuscula]UNZ12567.1 NADH dehydrogenase subunit 3 [Atkinsoniella flavipenna]UNZ12580.1 NADH dehydrogenase subunit 3 [Atkinsoniella longiuscula]